MFYACKRGIKPWNLVWGFYRAKKQAKCSDRKYKTSIYLTNLLAVLLDHKEGLIQSSRVHRALQSGANTGVMLFTPAGQCGDQGKHQNSLTLVDRCPVLI